jgi:hypothetical protein
MPGHRRKCSSADALPIRFRGRDLGDAEIAEIRRLLRNHRGLSRRQFSILLCRTWNWRRPNGDLRSRACRDLLLRLEERGHIKLPPARIRVSKTKPSRHDREDDEWAIAQPAIDADDIRLARVSVRPIAAQELGRWRSATARFHYLGDGQIVGETLRYVAEYAGQWLALVGWGAAALKSRHRESYVGWDEKTKFERLHLVANNVRFLILPWVRVPHLASSVLSKNLRRLSADWEAYYSHPILLVETFVDTERFRGTCYRASNWRYLGETRGVKRKRAGFEAHGRKKALFVYPLHPRATEILSAPFPSPEILRSTSMATTATLDVNQLPLEGEGGLIEVLRSITDPRKRRGIRHPFESVLALAVMAALSGMRSYESIAEWAKDCPKELLKRFRCWCHKAPSEPTFRRVLQSTNATEVDRAISAWLAQNGLGDALAIDGKTLRGSRDGEDKPLHLLSAITHDNGIVVGQEPVDEKTNEITRVEPLLDHLDLEGRTVTADALHTQKKFADYLVSEKQADYVLIAKDNQPTLLEDIKTLDWGSFSPSGEHARQRPRSVGES